MVEKDRAAGVGRVGSDDELVPIRESARALRAQLEAGPNADRTFRTFAGAGHGLAVGARDGNAIYASGFLELTARWLRDRLTPGTSRRVDDTPLPETNGVTVSRAIEPPGWHGTPAAQIAWAGLILGMAVVALVLRSGVPTGALVALIVLTLLSLPAGLALIIADDGQGVATVAEYPVPLWPTVALTTVSVAVAGRLLVVHARRSSSRRQHAVLAAISTAAALLVALVAYWLL